MALERAFVDAESARNDVIPGHGLTALHGPDALHVATVASQAGLDPDSTLAAVAIGIHIAEARHDGR